ncbi:MAG TPA: PilZ domain-containing protein [Myxococcota bacterium]|nr:PilZ domain-containing protein [Myxococcota bacterium]HRY92925.1 PilZ domain-containing protein [Myxococcota bacterium]HSA19856.1 PilZ domain-containing protein [Myxococcota bacterium]
MDANLKPVSVFLRSLGELRACYLAEAPFGGMVVEVGREVREEDLVELRLAFGEERFSLRGLVLWCRQVEGGRRLAGVGFLASEADTRERMMRHETGKTPPPIPGTDVERKDPRYDTTLKVVYETPGDFVMDYTQQNISAGGLFVASSRPPEVGSTILLRLYPPGESSPIDLPGQVAWRRTGQGFGVRFVALDDPARGRLDSLLRQTAASRPARPPQPRYEGLSV